MKKVALCIIAFIISSTGFSKTDAFVDYLSMFGSIEGNAIRKEHFKLKQLDFDSCLKKSIVSQYITKESDCRCKKDELRYFCRKKIDYNNYIIALLYKHCDIATKNNYPYDENMIIVYSKSGKMIDSKIISKSGDLWLYNLTGTTKPFQITVESSTLTYSEITQFPFPSTPCTINTLRYTINEVGKIVQEQIGSKKGSVIWDKGKNELVMSSVH
ncbi:MAG: hypothetical protein PHX49_02835 [Bacteroidales bacterium]|nr:hypothetical protein [Bacteroidales bacterium]